MAPRFGDSEAPKVHDPSEDRELLKLVGAVLETARKRKERKRFASEVLARLRRAKTAALRGTKKKPAVAICILVCCMSLSYVVGIVLTAFATTPIVPREIRPPGAEPTPVGFLPPPAFATGPGVSGRPVVRDTEGDDAATDVLRRMVEGDYERREDVATGRCLRDFDAQVLLLVDTDRTKLKVVRRGLGWLQLRAPYRLADTRSDHRTHLDDYFLLDHATRAHLRLLKQEDGWKLENIRVY